ncbi:MAG TPA: post-COAP-1 domain-containing protein [Acidobacteriota bacterium]|jgi:hypothetical protein
MKRISIKIPVVVFLLVTLFVFLPKQKANAWGGGGGQCFDFVTIGGFFFGSTDGPGRVNFGGNAGFKNGDPPPPLMAHLTVTDHNSGRQIKIDGTSDDGTVTCYGTGSGDPSDPAFLCRRLTGRATSTLGNVTTTGTFQCTICDFGEPGKDSDLFGIRVFNSAGTLIYDTDLRKLAGGNAQLHKPCSDPTPGCF